ncbi:MAG: cytochrome P450 [Anaerolineales bacterium]|nr:cytochrome P450 [Anaerolineales bacterium]
MARLLPPGPKGHPLLGMLPQMRSHRLQLVSDLYHTFGEISSFRLATKRTFFFINPDDVRAVFWLNTPTKCTKAHFSSGMLDRLSDKGCC